MTPSVPISLKKRPPHTDEDELLIQRLKLSLTRFPDARKTTLRAMQAAHRYSIHLALGSRGDPFARTDVIILLPRKGPDIRIMARELPITLGRSAQADYVIHGEGISDLHCRLEREGTLVRFSQAEPGAECRLNGRRTRGETLCDGDTIFIGSIEFLVKRA